jgi:hypothetical protein
VNILDKLNKNLSANIAKVEAAVKSHTFHPGTTDDATMRSIYLGHHDPLVRLLANHILSLRESNRQLTESIEGAPRPRSVCTCNASGENDHLCSVHGKAQP